MSAPTTSDWSDTASGQPVHPRYPASHPTAVAPPSPMDNPAPPPPPQQVQQEREKERRAHDPFYGHQETSEMAARFIISLFACPNIPPPSNPPGGPQPTLAHFVAYSLHRTRLPHFVTLLSLLLLHRLKQRFPQARGSSGHRLFISAFMIASKIVCDDTYSNQSWCIVGQKLFKLGEVNQMEREMCGYLEWNLNATAEQVAEFEHSLIAAHGPAAHLASLTYTSSSQQSLSTPSTSSASSSDPNLPATATNGLDRQLSTRRTSVATVQVGEGERMVARLPRSLSGRKGGRGSVSNGAAAGGDVVMEGQQGNGGYVNNSGEASTSNGNGNTNGNGSTPSFKSGLTRLKSELSHPTTTTTPTRPFYSDSITSRSCDNIPTLSALDTSLAAGGARKIKKPPTATSLRTARERGSFAGFGTGMSAVVTGMANGTTTGFGPGSRKTTTAGSRWYSPPGSPGKVPVESGMQMGQLEGEAGFGMAMVLPASTGGASMPYIPSMNDSFTPPERQTANQHHAPAWHPGWANNSASSSMSSLHSTYDFHLRLPGQHPHMTTTAGAGAGARAKSAPSLVSASAESSRQSSPESQACQTPSPAMAEGGRGEGKRRIVDEAAAAVGGAKVENGLRMPFAWS